MSDRLSQERAGVLLAVGSASCLAAVVLLGKLALRTLSPWGFTTFFFGFAALWFVVYLVATRDFSAFRPSRQAAFAGLLVTVLDSGYALTFNMALKVLHPAVHGFLGHIADLLAAGMGLIVLRERFSRLELGGIFVAFIGIVVMSARADTIEIRGLLLMLVSGAFFAVNIVAVKRYTQRHPPQHLAFYRATGIALVMFSTSLILHDFRFLVGREWPLMVALGFVGPFLGYLCFFHAIKRLEVGRVTVVRMHYSLLVLIGSVVFYGQLPRLGDLLGGLLLLAGVVTLVIEKTRLSKQPVRAPGAAG